MLEGVYLHECVSTARFQLVLAWGKRRRHVPARDWFHLVGIDRWKLSGGPAQECVLIGLCASYSVGGHQLQFVIQLLHNMSSLRFLFLTQGSEPVTASASLEISNIKLNTTDTTVVSVASH